MQRFVFARFLLLLSCLSFQSAWAATTVQFTLVRDYLIVVPVAVYSAGGGAGSYEFLLDTGANTTLVTPEFAQKLGLQPTDRLELVTVAGTQALPRAHLKRLSLGEQTISEVEVLVSDLQTIRSLRPTICGVLGQNALTQFNYLVDFRKQQLVLETGTELANKLGGVPLPLELHEGRALIRLANDWRWVVDSGIAMLCIFDAAARKKELALTDANWRPLRATSDLGSRTVWQANLPSFTIGHIVFRNLPLALFESSAAAEGRVERGLLPLRLFTSVYFNHRQQYLRLNPLPAQP